MHPQTIHVRPQDPHNGDDLTRPSAQGGAL